VVVSDVPTARGFWELLKRQRFKIKFSKTMGNQKDKLSIASKDQEGAVGTNNAPQEEPTPATPQEGDSQEPTPAVAEGDDSQEPMPADNKEEIFNQLVEAVKAKVLAEIQPQETMVGNVENPLTFGKPETQTNVLTDAQKAEIFRIFGADVDTFYCTTDCAYFLEEESAQEYCRQHFAGHIDYIAYSR
jgi:hypothetical protein